MPGRRLTASIIALCLGLLVGGAAHAGGLDKANSPYLLQHAEDAIDWYPWGEEALTRAREEDKLIFLSIGYATCYWCHVLARTTFTDDRVVETLNGQFVSILVDREERPDLDHHFASAMLAMTGRSGAPANFFLTPDLIPLFAAGYLAADPEYGEPGLLTVAQSLVSDWQDSREDIRRSAARIGDQLATLREAFPLGPARGGEDPRDLALEAWSKSFDPVHGGFGTEPKFPLPNVLSFLLNRAVWQHDPGLQDQVYATLDRMAASGLRDHLGGSFHRYVVDRFWQVPHFEIMLNDNALLARLYLEAYQASGKPRYAAVARDILEDLLSRFRLPGGGFAAALDAETEAREGLYYTWTGEEVRALLGPEGAAVFAEAYLDPVHGLVGGRSVLRLRGAPETLLATQARFAASLSRLREARAQRPAPLRDDKVLTAWNALAISAFAKAAQVLGEARYAAVAREEMAGLLARAAEAGRLSHSRWAGRAGAMVFLDDYAFLVEALIDLYETDFDTGHLDRAHRWMTELIARFQVAPGRPFRFKPLDQETGIPARGILKEQGSPSGNAAALMALHRLRLFGAEADFAAPARALSDGLGGFLETAAPSAPGLLRALDYVPREAHEIVIVGRADTSDTRALLHEARSRLLHGSVLAVIPPDQPGETDDWLLLAPRPLLDGKATAYVCRNRLCDLPVDRPEDLAKQLDGLVTQSNP